MNIKKYVTFTDEERPFVLSYMLQWFENDNERMAGTIKAFSETKDFEVVEVRENDKYQDGIEITYGDKAWQFSLFSLDSIQRFIVLKGKNLNDYDMT